MDAAATLRQTRTTPGATMRQTNCGTLTVTAPDEEPPEEPSRAAVGLLLLLLALLALIFGGGGA